MAAFVFVHGSSCGGWVWQRLTPLLRARGHDVYTPTLTGLSERIHLLRCRVNLATHINDIVNLIYYEDLSEVILVGNSYGGMVMTGVAGKVPERLKLLIYLDAYLPEDGQSEADLLPDDILAARQAEAARHRGLIQPPPLALFGVSDPALMDWMTKRMTPQPFATYLQPVQADSGMLAAIPGIYIHCSGNPANTPDLFATSAAKALARGWPVYDLAAGHMAMLTAPHAVSEILLHAAEKEEREENSTHRLTPDSTWISPHGR